MKYTPLGVYKISDICFGSSTFVRGKLNPNADSKKGESSLRYAIESGINFVHSNPNLDTQWAIRDVVKEFPQRKVENLIKVEVPLQRDYHTFKDIFLSKVQNSLIRLSVQKIAGVIYEKDKKRTSVEQLSDKRLVSYNYTMARNLSDQLRTDGKIGLLFSLSDSPEDMEIAAESKCFNGLAAYFSLFDLWPANYFDYLQSKSLDFLAIRPLRHGIFVGKQVSRPDKAAGDYMNFLFDSMNADFIDYINQFMTKKSPYDSLQNLSIKFALAHPVVKTAIVGAASKEHLSEIIRTADNPMPYADYSRLLNELKSRRDNP
jgi:aryl-alcohol dehydrogenase-like predicted oxidoreductase